MFQRFVNRYQLAAPSPASARWFRCRVLCCGFAVAVVLAAASAASTANASGGAAPAASSQGLAVFEAAKCARCHSVRSLDIEAQMQPPMRGPTLDERGVDRTRAWLENYLKGREELNGKSHLFRWRGSDQDLKALVDWLLELQEKP